MYLYPAVPMHFTIRKISGGRMTKNKDAHCRKREKRNRSMLLFTALNGPPVEQKQG